MLNKSSSFLLIFTGFSDSWDVLARDMEPLGESMGTGVDIRIGVAPWVSLAPQVIPCDLLDTEL